MISCNNEEYEPQDNDLDGDGKYGYKKHGIPSLIFGHFKALSHPLHEEKTGILSFYFLFQAVE
jgi:hypothetical protein